MTGPAASLPRVDVIVPTYNEAATIAGKIANLAALTYPADLLRIVVADGGSDDDTTGLARAAATASSVSLRIIEVRCASKPAQLNAGWLVGDAPYVLVTDADSQLPPHVLEQLVGMLERDPQCALAGTAVRSASPFVVERVFWHYSNRLRAAEARLLGSAGLVVGPCYLARRSMLEPFRGDIVSDDAHVSLSALARGLRVAYIDVPVAELRGPTTLMEFLRHKHRKAAGYLREVLRVVGRRNRLALRQRRVLVLRVFLLSVLPWLLAGVGGWTMWHWPLQATAAAGCAVAGLARRSMVRSHPWPPLAGGLAVVALPWMVAAMLIATMVSYPFVRQSASYPKVTLFADPEA